MDLSRYQLVRLGALLLVAFLLRAWAPGRMAIEHFDEGVYAASSFSPQLGYRYPDLHLYAPPLFPSLLKSVLNLTGGHPHAVMWVNVFLGTLLVAAVWWTTRELAAEGDSGQQSAVNGRQSQRKGKSSGLQPSTINLQPASNNQPAGAALAAAALVAFSEMFIQYSRAALTDIAVCLWMTLAVGCGSRALRQGGVRWLLAAAVTTALAWWTKYNGWLPLAILGSASVGWIVFELISSQLSSSLQTPAAPAFRSVLIRFAVIAVLAVLLWLPCLQGLQAFGGYAAVSRNHAGYVVGWSGWLDSLTRHLAVDRKMSRSVTLVGVLLGLQLAGTVFTWNARGWQRTHLSRVIEYIAYVMAIFALPLTYFAGLLPTLAGGVLLWLGLGIRNWPKRNRSLNLRDTILLAWLAGLLLATPLYRPYPRLILPLLTGVCIAAAIGWSRLFSTLYTGALTLKDGQDHEALGLVSAGDNPFPATARIAGYRPVLFLGMLAAVLWFALAPSPAWQDRTGLAVAVTGMVGQIRNDMAINSPRSKVWIIYVLAEPGLYYHLAHLADRVDDDFLAQPAAGLKVLEKPPGSEQVPVYLVTGPHSRSEEAELAKLPDQVRSLGEIPYNASNLVLLDEYPPAALNQVRSQPLFLWAVK